MKKEIIVGVVAAILASVITYVTTNIDKQLTKVQLQEIADNIVRKDAFIKVLLNEFSKDERFIAKNGTDGENGKPGVSNVVKSGTNWCALMGEAQQICWGYKELSKANEYTRNFDFTFANSFSQKPVVTNGINANSSGWAFSVYTHNISASVYSGSIVEHTSRKSKAPVNMSYVAIGKR